MPDSAVLQRLHELLSERADARGQLQSGTAQLVARRKALDALRAKVESRKDANRILRKDIDQQEVGLRSHDARRRELQVKLNMSTNSKEFEALKDEIARIETSISQTEDEILGRMGDFEEKLRLVADEEAEYQRLEEEFRKLKELIDYRSNKFTERIAILDAAIAEQESTLEPATREDLKRLQKSRGDSSVAEFVNGSCGVCYAAQPPQTPNDLKMGRAAYCLSCGAILFLRVS